MLLQPAGTERSCRSLPDGHWHAAGDDDDDAGPGPGRSFRAARSERNRR